MSEAPKYKILLVDDEHFNIKLLAGILTPHYKLLAAKSGQEALKRAFSDSPPDLILLDIMMPDMNGYEVCRRLKATPRTRDIPIIFISALSEVENEAKGLELGAVDYLIKPVKPAVVRARVKNHLALMHAYKEIEAQRQRLEEQNVRLQETNRLREDVEHIARHDLKNPLSAIMVYLQLFHDNSEILNPIQQKTLARIEEAVYRMTNMLNQSVELLKMERRTYQLHPVAVDLMQLLNKIVVENHQQIRQKKLRVTIQFTESFAEQNADFYVSGEELLCYSMLSNLLKNAIEASPPHEEIQISLEKKQEAIVRIHNKGVVPEAVRKNFFDKYVTSGKHTLNTGLGTYSAKLIAETQHGRLRMDTSEAEGTLLTIYMPRVPGEIHAGLSSSRDDVLERLRKNV